MKAGKPLPKKLMQRIYEGEPALKVLREHRGLAIEDLATRCGLTADFLTDCESGSRFIPPRNMPDVAEALGVGVLDLGHFTQAFGDCDFVTRNVDDDLND